MRGSVQPDVVNGLLEERRFREAADFITGQTGNSLRGRLIQDLARQWLKADEQEALAWLSSVTGSADRLNALFGIFDSLAESDPAIATKCALSLHEPVYRRIALSRVLQPLLRAGDAQAIASWLRAGAGLSDYDAARESAIAHLARSDPAAATALLKDIVDPKVKNEAVLVISRSAPVRPKD